MKPSFATLVLFLSCSTVWAANDSDEPVAEDPSDCAYARSVFEHQPIAYWRFEEQAGETVASRCGEGESPRDSGVVEAAAKLGVPGPRPDLYPKFDGANQALAIEGPRGFVRVADPGDHSLLDFQLGDSITLEAWVNPSHVANNQQIYIVGKGRTNNPGSASDNQNYALRLRGEGSMAKASFLFRSAADAEHGKSEFHRWNSQIGFVPDGRWHHVAVTYTFGSPETIRGYVDGQASDGIWDYGGATARAPVIDNDELWIGSSMGGNPGSTFVGAIDEVAIYRSIVPDSVLRARYAANVPKPMSLAEQMDELPTETVVVDIFENVADRSWSYASSDLTFTMSVPVFGFVQLPKKYVDGGVIADRSNPHLVRARLKRSLPAGEYRFLLRALNGSRLLIDGKVVAETDFISRNASGHEEVPDLPQSQFLDIQPLAPGHSERVASVTLDEGMHLFCLEAAIGAKGARDEVGELCVAYSAPDEPFQLLGPSSASPISLGEQDWQRFAAESRARIAAIDQQSRTTAAASVAKYWQRRHAWARDVEESFPRVNTLEPAAGYAEFNQIDRFINTRLAEAGVQAADLTDDFSFLRRLALDTIGVVPTDVEIREFIADSRPDRRARWIDRYLEDPRWADNWVGYWQDVLAENPGILKPELNNTGPFRWWIYESLLDNKPMDQFVTELIAMRGSKYGGGPAGFAMSTQNDVPMAAKAHVVAKAFLGLDMTCARCHDAPYHPYTQRELFGLAAMLDRKSIKLPESSTVPISPGARKPLVEITLKPGESIDPHWSFASLVDTDFPSELLKDPSDSREQLAALITSPQNDRFPRMMVNRLWHRFVGRGIVEPVDDWFDVEPSHPELLDYLGREFLTHDYDLKHVARLILNSHAYQRTVQTGEPATSASGRLFASPSRRRMTAEQVVDSLFAVCGKPTESEALTLDPEGRRPATTFLNLSVPTHGWQFTSLSNERDRPALALPVAQSVVDVLLAFGWRDSRPNPLTERENAPTVIQPLTIANGTVVNRVCQLSDNSELTEICLEDVTVDELVDRMFLRILGRLPDSDERQPFITLLSDGFESRRLEDGAITHKTAIRTTVSWANHLSAEATRIKMELERSARAGDPPSGRLESDWRERMEDAIWSLVNSPEFVFVP